jgi:hypothetical protein
MVRALLTEHLTQVAAASRGKLCWQVPEMDHNEYEVHWAENIEEPRQAGIDFLGCFDRLN